MNFKHDSSWSNSLPINGWSKSHGTPTVSPTSIWLWSYNNYGEGVNYEYHFEKGLEYCYELLVETKV
jgi:hypothetical protein